MTPSQEESAHEEIVTGDGNEFTPMHIDLKAYIPYYIAQTENMSQRDWTDLVCLDDYFVSIGGMMRTTPLPKKVTEGEFVVSLSPHMFLVGDCITRSMLLRIRTRIAFLAEARSVFCEAICASGHPY